MKATQHLTAAELMVGDWVMYGDKPVQVLQLTAGKEYKEFFPVPLTPEILEKNGFFYPPQGTWMKLENPFRPLYACLHTDGGWWLYSSDDCDKGDNFAVIRFVHELQHALKLCGIDKTIEL